MTFKARHIFIPIAAIALGICVFVVFLDYRDDFHRALNVPPTSHYADDIPNLVTAYYSRSDASGIEWILSEVLASRTAHSPSGFCTFSGVHITGEARCRIFALRDVWSRAGYRAGFSVSF